MGRGPVWIACVVWIGWAACFVDVASQRCHPKDPQFDLACVCQRDDDCPFGKVCVAGACKAEAREGSGVFERPGREDSGDSGSIDRAGDEAPSEPVVERRIVVERRGERPPEPSTAPEPRRDAPKPGECRDGQQQSCYPGDPSAAGKGICKGGVKTCSGGVWGKCLGYILPNKETCNGLDDDCDGQIDELLERLCYPGKVGCVPSKDSSYQCVGECKVGKQSCQKGQWGSCVGAVLPSVEKCDGKDTDCNGKADQCKNNTPGKSVAVCSSDKTQVLTCSPDCEQLQVVPCSSSQRCGGPAAAVRCRDCECDVGKRHCRPSQPLKLFTCQPNCRNIRESSCAAGSHCAIDPQTQNATCAPCPSSSLRYCSADKGSVREVSCTTGAQRVVAVCSGGLTCKVVQDRPICQ